MSDFLPLTIEDVMQRGWERPDFVYVIGDAYVDHSSFGPAIISRVLEANGYKVAIISQPDWTREDSIDTFGEPRLGFLVSAGNMDSMVNHYTVNKKRRHNDAYTPGGVAGKRPDYATIVYCNMIKKKYKNKPVIIGGIEASLRRLAHYDYWSDKVRRSVLMDSGADILLYGMGEKSVVEVADALASGIDATDITYVAGTVYKAKEVEDLINNQRGILLPEYDSIKSDKEAYAKSFQMQYANTDFATARILIEKYGNKRYVVQNPPSKPLTMQEMDDIYELPYTNDYHPSYKDAGGVPAINEIKFSLTSNRGCFGGCSFCALTFHQGRVVQVRSHESLVREAKKMTEDPDFKGYIHDVGGPTANFRRAACNKQFEHGACPNKQCLYPKPCDNLIADHSDYIALLRKLRALPKVKKVFVRSGIRYDYVMADKKNDFLAELCRYHVSGQLRVAPEHITDHVLDLMGKPRASVYESFVKKFDRVNKQYKLNQFVVPYLISSHPGSDLKDAIALAESIRDMGYMPEQVQDFYPTPSTISTCMYYTGLDPRSMKKVYVTRNPHEKAMQRALIQYRKPENYDLVKEALLKSNRSDLIGYDRNKCLIPPRLSDKETGAGNKENFVKKSDRNKSAMTNDGRIKSGKSKAAGVKADNHKADRNKIGKNIPDSKSRDRNRPDSHTNDKHGNNKAAGRRTSGKSSGKRR